MTVEKRKAVALYSGGLDSILAIRLIQQQGIEVIGLYLKTPFLKEEPDPYGEKYLNIPLIVKDIFPYFRKLLLHPKYGFGKNENPCIDCRILMFKKAGELMVREKASFVISGEVLGQRPMTQNKNNLFLISKESGYGDFILRPLSAILLPETKPERTNIVNRSRLMDIQGRSRKRQMELAKRWGIVSYPSPAGGCKLTEPGFAHRMKDLLSKGYYDSNDIELLKVGRHFNIHQSLKLVVGRNEKENKIILSLAKPDDFLLSSSSHKGPISLLRCYSSFEKQEDELMESLDLAGRITGRYCDKERDTDLIDIYIREKDSQTKKLLQVTSLSEQDTSHYLI
ncbi:MAG: tRNA 4-thiouridine(8) synthase ThiI [Candidatus Atribacteria bacterium]|nr:tRNA 4-thiouridine(8) synthase ThiI [Candidatus Atribacteria bacterium]